MNDSWRAGEVVSEMMDGRLSESAFSEAAAKLASHAQARALWHHYHVVGDVLRSGDLAPHADEAAFLNRLQQRLQLEVAPSAVLPSACAVLIPEATSDRVANDARFSWKWGAGLASLVLVVAAAWNIVGAEREVSSAPQWVRADVPASSVVALEAAAPGPIMVRDARLDQLLLAHRQSAGQSALQVSSGFLRNATFAVSSQSDGK